MAILRMFVYLASFTGVGYALMEALALNQEKLQKELSPTAEPITEAEKKKKLFMEALKSAADNKQPMYRQSSKEN
jgi:Ubiquinol-cytochrome-c reductase complex assembly factor 3